MFYLWLLSRNRAVTKPLSCSDSLDLWLRLQVYCLLMQTIGTIGLLLHGRGCVRCFGAYVHVALSSLLIKRVLMNASAYRFSFSALLYCRLFKHPPPMPSSSLGFSPLALSLALSHTDMGCCLRRLAIQFLHPISTTPCCSITLKGTVHPKSKILSRCTQTCMNFIQTFFLEQHKGE